MIIYSFTLFICLRNWLCSKIDNLEHRQSFSTIYVQVTSISEVFFHRLCSSENVHSLSLACQRWRVNMCNWQSITLAVCIWQRPTTATLCLHQLLCKVTTYNTDRPPPLALCMSTKNTTPRTKLSHVNTATRREREPPRAPSRFFFAPRMSPKSVRTSSLGETGQTFLFFFFTLPNLRACADIWSALFHFKSTWRPKSGLFALWLLWRENLRWVLGDSSERSILPSCGGLHRAWTIKAVWVNTARNKFF